MLNFKKSCLLLIYWFLIHFCIIFVSFKVFSWIFLSLTVNHFVLVNAFLITLCDFRLVTQVTWHFFLWVFQGIVRLQQPDVFFRTDPRDNVYLFSLASDCQDSSQHRWKWHRSVLNFSPGLLQLWKPVVSKASTISDNWSIFECSFFCFVFKLSRYNLNIPPKILFLLV